ncbi:hypothetical protein [Hugenholtzia roseola]|uniref:hypothetical protein n=1 Tax=Hugenholtzia roseola TaxID=1002 RepID=UPI0003F66E1C|nr:hypothetical protein [Hugenholtzia roseola]
MKRLNIPHFLYYMTPFRKRSLSVSQRIQLKKRRAKNKAARKSRRVNRLNA